MTRVIVGGLQIAFVAFWTWVGATHPEGMAAQGETPFASRPPEHLVDGVVPTDVLADGEELAVLNRRLHFTIYHAGSELIASHASSLWSLFPPRVTIWAVPDAAAALAADHDGIIEALRARDAKLAQNRARDHVLHAADLREHL